MNISVIIRLWHDRRGSAAVWAVLLMVSFLGVTALVLDMGYLWVLKNNLQSTADSTSLAGASRLVRPGQIPNVTQVKSRAVGFAGKNMPAAPHGTVLLEPDVILGHWDGRTRTFTPHPDVNNTPFDPAIGGGQTTNAVKTYTRRADANGNPVPLFFARILRVFQSDVVTGAITEAHGGSAKDNCQNNGIITGGKVFSGSANQLIDAFCVHGELGVKVGSQSDYSGSYISMPDVYSMAEYGQDNVGVDECLPMTDPPKPLPCVMGEQSLRPELADNVAAMIAGMKNDVLTNALSNLPSNVEITSVSTTLPAGYNTGSGQWGIPGTAYVIDGIVDINSQRILDNVVIIATEGISIGSD
ncbi:MAG: Tad domain-containing protein [Alphaproteobacteria bacterium]